MNPQHLTRITRRFLFSTMSKQLLVFLFFLFLSGAFWLILTLNETYEQEVKVLIRIKGVPRNAVLTSSETDTIRVTLRDKGWVIMGYLYNHTTMINIPFKTYDRGQGKGAVSSSELRRLIELQLESSTSIISMKPDRVDFSYNNGERKRVPVRWAGRVIPEQLYFISHVQYWPDSVDVYASSEKLDSIRAMFTEPLNYAGFRDTLMVDCRLAHIKDVKVVPEYVRIGFFTDVLTEESIDGVTIQAINMPKGKVLRTFPQKVKVNFITGVNQFRSLRPEDFTVVADYQEIMQHPSDKCNIYLRNVPHGISRATLEMKQVDYLIEEE